MKNEVIKIESVIDLQIRVSKIKNSINIDFNKAVDKIIKCKSKIVICGVKSGIIASKIS